MNGCKLLVAVDVAVTCHAGHLEEKGMPCHIY